MAVVLVPVRQGGIVDVGFKALLYHFILCRCVCRRGHRYVPVGLLERYPIHLNDRVPSFVGRDDLETLMASSQVQCSRVSCVA